MKLELKLIQSPQIKLEKLANKAWQRTITSLTQWARQDFVNTLIYGGNGIEGIAQTEFYRWVTSAQGLSELGIPPSEPPKLLQAYKTVFRVNKTYNSIELKFGEKTKLKLLTPHPAAGTGHLHIQSWLEFADDSINIKRGFVPRGKIPGKAQKTIRLSAPLGGLMLPRGALGSSGLWRFPNRLKNYEEAWLKRNIKLIENILIEKFKELFIKELQR